MKEPFFTRFFQHLNFTKFTKILFSCLRCFMSIFMFSRDIKLDVSAAAAYSGFDAN